MTERDHITEVEAEPVFSGQPDRFAHLSDQRGLIVRRSLLASAIRGFLPVPVADDVLARRVRAGLYQKLASGRQVDLPPACAAILAEGKGESAAAGMTFAAVAMLVAKFAGRKFLAVLAAGRGADEMARTFLKATLLDHYCAKLHVGGPITEAEARRLRTALLAQEGQALRGPILAAFRDGSRMLGRSLLEAPRWLSRQLSSLGERFVHSGGNPDVLDATPVSSEGESAWLDRAAQAVETDLAQQDHGYLARVVADFEERWRSE